MGNEEETDIQSLQEKLTWIKEQDCILEKIEKKLYAMREIAVYAAENKCTSVEINELNRQMDQLKKELELLKAQLNTYH